MDFFSKNLTYLRTIKGISQAELAEFMGFSTRTTISNYENGRGKPGFDDLIKISQYFNVSIDDILNKQLALGSTEIVEEPGVFYNAKQINPIGLQNCYYVPIKAYGGFLNGFDKPYYLESLEKFQVPFISGECFCFEVDGFSMADEYLPNDKVYCTAVNSINDLIKGKDYVVQTTDGIILKKFMGISGDSVILKSNNEDPRYLMSPVQIRDIRRFYYIEEHLRKPNKK